MQDPWKKGGKPISFSFVKWLFLSFLHLKKKSTLSKIEELISGQTFRRVIMSQVGNKKYNYIQIAIQMWMHFMDMDVTFVSHFNNYNTSDSSFENNHSNIILFVYFCLNQMWFQTPEKRTDFGDLINLFDWLSCSCILFVCVCICVCKGEELDSVT